MFDHQLRVAKDRQATLRAETQQTRTGRRPGLGSIAAIVRIAFPGIDVASGTVLPATH